MRKLKIAKVHWLDASNYPRENDIKWLKENACGTEFITVGHLIRKNRKEVVLAHEITEYDDARSTSFIPWKVVSKIEYLEVKDATHSQREKDIKGNAGTIRQRER